MAGFFTDVPERIAFGGVDSSDPLSYRVYEPDRLVPGKRMEDHLRIAVCLWHSFNWPGSDVFGAAPSTGPGSPGDDPMEPRERRSTRPSIIGKLGVPFFTFHDQDVAPEGHTFADTVPGSTRWSPRSRRWAYRCRLRGGPQSDTLRGTPPAPPPIRTPRSSPTPPPGEAHARGHKSARGRELRPLGRARGLETLLNTDLAREEAQLARFLALVAEHKHRIGFDGTLLLEPKPQEPTKHQYDYDSATVDASSSATGSRTSTGSTSRPTTPRWRATASSTRSPWRWAAGSSAAST